MPSKSWDNAGFKKNRQCVICRGTRKRILFKQRFSGFSDGSLLDGYVVVVCQDCGFCFADNIPAQAAFDIYYREMSKYEHQEREGQPSEFEGRQFPELAQFLAQNIPYKQASILEIGCANGGLLHALQKRGDLNVLGIDPSPVCAHNAERLYQISVLAHPLSDIKLEIGPFDFIILVAVLEHIQDLDGTITKVHDLLSPAGRLYIEAPDATHFSSSVDAPFQEFSIEHINFFSPLSLQNLLGAHGFSKVFSIQTFYQQTDNYIGHAIRMMFEKSKVEEHFEVTRDLETQSALEKYIAVSRQEETHVQKTINELIDCHIPLIVWGAGTHTQRLLASSQLSDANIIVFVDSNPNYHGKHLNGKPIVAPIQLAGMNEPILISSKVFQSEIIHQIRDDLNLKNEIITLYED